MPRPAAQPNWYAILAINPDADDAAIRAAHRRRARELHPDINASPDATARMIEVNRARDVLLDPRARARFDREYAGGYASSAPPRAPRARPAGRATAAGPIRFTFNHARTDRVVEDLADDQHRPRATDWRFDPHRPFSHDWYAFLGLPPWATGHEIQAAIAHLAPEVTRPTLSPEERQSRAEKLRMAWQVLGQRATREAYDASRPPWRPRPGMPDLYRIIGVRSVASTETIGAAVARHARALGTRPVGAAREREAAIREAWWVLRDAGRRAAYDAFRAGQVDLP